MSFTWRYVVRPDGSFCRLGNLDGSLDNVSDEELARLHPRCVGDLQERLFAAFRNASRSPTSGISARIRSTRHGSARVL